ncbi:MAG: aryl-alcohol dehydrogenase-like predicted oxidoreductase [Gammaproteobacteria bacterium]|jgi:aryl-alcohol dehydrogenase-like predicted oxidoreductase
MSDLKVDRRDFIQLVGGGAMAMATTRLVNAQQSMISRAIPVTGELLPVIGLGTSDEFERNTSSKMDDLKDVLTTLQDAGGTLVDTAPTYGNAESVLGRLFSELNIQQQLFIATKISLWSVPFLSKQAGIDQMMESEQVMGKAPLDLIQVHNLNDLDTQWDNLVEWKAAGKVRYIGVTIYTYRQFERLEEFMRKATGVDFVQLNYSLLEPRAENVLIPLSADKGAAIIVNRPFGNGGYFQKVSNKSLPEWAKEFDCDSWAQFTLKWILSNPDVACAIPATSNARHMLDNTRAGYGRLPDQNQRRKMLSLMQSI